MTKEKKWIISFNLEQLVAHRSWQVAEATAPDLALAIKRAWAVVKKRPEVKGKRMKTGSVKFKLCE